MDNVLQLRSYNMNITIIKSRKTIYQLSRGQIVRIVPFQAMDENTVQIVVVIYPRKDRSCLSALARITDVSISDTAELVQIGCAVSVTTMNVNPLEGHQRTVPQQFDYCAALSHVLVPYSS